MKAYTQDKSESAYWTDSLSYFSVREKKTSTGLTRFPISWLVKKTSTGRFFLICKYPLKKGIQGIFLVFVQGVLIIF